MVVGRGHPHCSVRLTYAVATMTHLATIGAWIANLSYPHLPERTVRAARYQILNLIGAAHGAGRFPEIRSLARAPLGFAGPGRATVLATGARLGPADAALANAVCAMGHDFDDIVWMGHTCHSAVFASLAVAEHEAAGSETLLAAVVAANEIGGRLGASSFFGPVNGQMWTFIHLVGGAAAAAKILGLDAVRTTHALGIALSQPNFPLQAGFMRPTSKLLAAAIPTATGIQAAYFARAGMTGAADILEDSKGFWHRFAFVPLPAMLEGLGTQWVTQTLTVKSYPGCHFFQTAGSAVDAIAARCGPLAGRVTRIAIDTTKLGMEVTSFARGYAPTAGPIEQVNVNFDLSATVAVQLVAGRLTSDEMDPAWLAANTPAIRALIANTRVAHDPELTARVIEGANAIGSGRRAIASLTPGDLLTVVRRYRAEYRSNLITPAEALGWLKVVGSRLRRRRAETDPRDETDSAAPLYFPNRVTLDVDGRAETARVDLPVGSFAAPSCADELERKVIRECAHALGGDRARALHAAGLDLPRTTVAELVRLGAVDP